jgi:RNA polymerase sigma-70 factor, ECF subfamily
MTMTSTPSPPSQPASSPDRSLLSVVPSPVVDVAGMYRETVDEVYRYVNRLTVGNRALTEDIVQETYIALVRHTTSNPAPDSPIAWLIRVARNNFLQQIRRTGRETRLLELVTNEAAVAIGHDDNHDQHDDDGLAVMRSMPADERAVLVLHHGEGVPLEELASALGRTELATRQLASRARKRFRRLHEGSES